MPGPRSLLGEVFPGGGAGMCRGGYTRQGWVCKRGRYTRGERYTRDTRGDRYTRDTRGGRFTRDRYMRGEGGYTRGGISIQEWGQYTRGGSGTSEGVGGWKAGAVHPTGIFSCETCKPNGLII